VKKKLSYIVSRQIRVVFLNAVVKDGHDHSSSCEALSPGLLNIQISVTGIILQGKRLLSLTITKILNASSLEVGFYFPLAKANVGLRKAPVCDTEEHEPFWEEGELTHNLTETSQ